jgi:hypothetical protein
MLMRLLYALQQQQPFAFLVGTTHSFSLLFPFSLSNQKYPKPNQRHFNIYYASQHSSSSLVPLPLSTASLFRFIAS